MGIVRPVSLESVGREGVIVCQYRRRTGDDAFCESQRPGYGQAWEGDHYTTDSSRPGDLAMDRACGARALRMHPSRCVYPRADDPHNICCR